MEPHRVTVGSIVIALAGYFVNDNKSLISQTKLKPNYAACKNPVFTPRFALGVYIIS